MMTTSMPGNERVIVLLKIIDLKKYVTDQNLPVLLQN